MSKSTYLAVALLLVVNVYAEEEEKSGKVLSFFNVVKFPNSLCKGSGTQNGTCYTKEECEDRKGKAAGTCADGFGVCCVIQLGCGGKSAENNTYFVLASTSSPPTTCTFEICPLSSSICRIKLDFMTFTIVGSVTISTATTTTAVAAAKVAGGAVGDCATDSFSAPNAPIICGVNTGQHIFLDSDGISCSKNTFSFGGSTSSRVLDIMVKQYECANADVGGPAGCLQYFTGETGTIKSFGFVSTSSVHLSNQDYSACIRRKSTHCSICYSVDPSGSYGLGISATTTKAEALSGASCIGDYIVIPHANTATIAATTTVPNTPDRYCGRFLTTSTTLTANADVCTNARPFKISFVADAGEVVTDGTTAKKAKTSELSTAPLGTIGFSLKYTQKSC